MNDIITISGIRGFIDENGVAQLNAEDVARGWGFTQTQTKNGKQYTSVRWERVNGYLKEFGFILPPKDGEEFPPLVGESDFIPENMVYRLGFKASNEAAQVFQGKLADEVLPALRKTGTYSINPVANIKQQEAEARLRNARSREANMYYKLAEKYPNNPLYQQVLHSKATEALAGRALIPLPEVEERLYSATEMGKKLGLSKNMIGRISEKYGLKTEQWGKWHEDVSPHNGKEVQTFRYKAAAIEKIGQCWELEQQERQKSKPLEVVKGGAAQ